MDSEELALGRKLKQDKLDLFEVHKYGLDSVAQLHELRKLAEEHHRHIEQLLDDIKLSEETYKFASVREYYATKAEATEKYDITIEQLLKDRETAKALNQPNVKAYYDLRDEGLAYRVTPQQLLKDRAEARKLHLSDVKALYRQRLEEKAREVRVTIAGAGALHCKVVRSKVAGDYVYYGDFLNTEMYRFDRSWQNSNGSYTKKVVRRAQKGLPSCVIVHRPWYKPKALGACVASSLFPAGLFGTGMLNGDGDEGPPLSVSEEIVGKLVGKKERYATKAAFFKIVTAPAGESFPYTWDEEETEWSKYDSQETVPMAPIASVEALVQLLSRAVRAPVDRKTAGDGDHQKKDPYAIYRNDEEKEPKNAGKKVYVPKYVGKGLNVGQPTIAPPWLSGPGGFPTTMNSVFEEQTTWVLRLVVKRVPKNKKESSRSKLKARCGVISLVDLCGNADKSFTFRNKAIARNFNADLIGVQNTLKAFGSNKHQVPPELFKSNLVYHLLRPSFPIIPCLKVPPISKKAMNDDFETFEKIQSLSQSYYGTFAIVIVELGKHNMDHVDRLDSWTQVYQACTGYQNALIIQMSIRTWLARIRLQRLRDAKQLRLENEAAIKVQTRIRMKFARKMLRKKRIEQKKAQLKAKQDAIKAKKRKELQQARLQKKRALAEKKSREAEAKIMAEGGPLPEGWNKEMRGSRWCFQNPTGEWTWDDPRR